MPCFMKLKPSAARLKLLALAGVAPFLLAAPAMAQTATIGGTVFTSQGLQGVGRLSASLRDKFGETFGSMSALSIDLNTWRLSSAGTYSGTLYLLPDRGYNVVGTTDYRDRINIVDLNFTPYTGTANLAAGAAQQSQIVLNLRDTFLITEQNGNPTSGLDPQGAAGVNTFRAAGNGFPILPQTPTGKIAMDPEGIVRARDGSFYVSDEYGPYIYHLTADGKIISAIRPPNAFIPIRNGVENYSANAAPAGVAAPVPADPVTGRQNNQGLEGLSMSADGTKLYALLQSATRQDGGLGGTAVTRDKTRLLVYNVGASADSPALIGEYVVPLPKYASSGTGAIDRVAAQSEILALNESQFLIIARDSGFGLGLSASPSIYRRVDIFDISAATNIAGTAYDGTTPVAPGGVLAAGVTASTYTTFININDALQLDKYGLSNGGASGTASLSEKWEALGLASALDPAKPDDFFLLVGNDNDFLTTTGFQVGAPYVATADSNTTLLAYRLTLPTYVDPIASQSQALTAGPLGQALAQTALSGQRAAAIDQTGRIQAVRSGLGGIRPANTFDAAIGGDWQRLDADGNVMTGAKGTDSWSIGGAVDYAWADGVRLGLGVGYSDSDGDFGALGKASANFIAVGPYVNWQTEDFYVDASYRYVNIDIGSITRNTGAYGMTATGKTGGRGHNFAVEGGPIFGSDGLRYGPVAGLTHDSYSLDAWQETGAIHLNLNHPKQSVEQTLLSVSGFISQQFDTEGATLVPMLQLGYSWGLGNDGTRGYTTVLSNRVGSSLASQTALIPSPSSDGFTLRGGLTIGFGTMTLVFNGGGVIGSDDSGDSWSVGTALRAGF